MVASPGGPRRASAADRASVIDILTGAFHDDPTWGWALPDPTTRAARYRRLWPLFVEGALRYPWVWLTPGATATSVWIPPGGTEFPPAQEAEFERVIGDAVGGDAHRVLQLCDAFDRAHPHDVPHFYLSLLGTAPRHRGHGYGLGLLADNLRHVDAAAMPAYLESSDPGNVPRYERYGFVVRGTFVVPDGGPEVVTMWREPRPVD